MIVNSKGQELSLLVASTPSGPKRICSIYHVEGGKARLVWKENLQRTK